jgi:hypothetical protein
VRIRDRSDRHRRLYCDDVPAERPHRDGPLGRFLSALLLFVLEPMVARSILPTLGGTPMVWNTRRRGTEVVDPVEAGALRHAQRDVRAVPRFRAPRYRAAIRLVGAP